MYSYRPIQVRDCQGALWAFYRQYEGLALASFEGDLSSIDFNVISGSSDKETSALKRQTLSPDLDFVVVPITSENIVALKSLLSKPGVLGKDGTVIHTQIEVGGETIFSACDNFHDDCTVTSRNVPKAFLEQLKQVGVLRGYSDS